MNLSNQVIEHFHRLSNENLHFDSGTSKVQHRLSLECHYFLELAPSTKASVVVEIVEKVIKTLLFSVLTGQRRKLIKKCYRRYKRKDSINSNFYHCIYGYK